MKSYVYILYFSESDRFYVGSTDDLTRRLNQHENGHTHSTKRLGKFNVAFTQEFDSLRKARTIEAKIKSWKRRDFIEKIIRDRHIKISTCSSAG